MIRRAATSRCALAIATILNRWACLSSAWAQAPAPAPVSMLSDRSSASGCPGGAVIDQIEGGAMRVLGASGVRSIATSAVSSTEPIREGMRVRLARDGQCVIDPPERALSLRVRSRLRALQRRGERPSSDAIDSRK